MNNSELEKLLKSAPVPERAPEFWEQLPKRVTARIHWRKQRAVSPTTARTRIRVAWAVCVCFLGIVLILPFVLRRAGTLREPFGSVAQVEKCYREIEAMFPNQVQAIIFDEGGSHIVLAEKADVPDSTPLYLKICGPRGCQQVVTFSGQQIRVNGDNWDVMSDAVGNVLLVGRNFAWSSESHATSGSYRIEARTLGMSS